MNQKDYVKIFDTTLRDGEQSPGATMNTKEKVQIANQLEKMKIDIIEAGFPVSSSGDFDSVQAISKEIKESTICALARCSEKDIFKASEALADARKRRIHVFIATSKIHREYKLKKSCKDILKMAVESVTYARSLVSDIEFSAEDATRTEYPFLVEVLEAVIAAGATTINIPDTVGYSTPFEMAQLISYLKKNVSDIDKVTMSVHCHDDLGMAVANSLSAIKEGVRQVECAINGIGERAGNCSTEEIVMAMKTREQYFNLRTRVVSQEICKTSKMVSRITGMFVQPNKAIVGVNAFAHEAGIHQDGILKNRNTYEIMNPEDVGWGQSELVLGKHSGRHAFEDRLKTLGYDLEEEDREKLFIAFKSLCDKKKVVYNEDLLALITNVLNLSDNTIFSLERVEMNYSFSSKNTQMTHLARAYVKNNNTQEHLSGTASGDGPVFAILQAVKNALNIDVTLLSYKIRSVTSGQDALGEVVIKVQFENKFISTGRFVSVDVLEAGAQALLNACQPYFSSSISKIKEK